MLARALRATALLSRVGRLAAADRCFSTKSPDPPGPPAVGNPAELTAEQLQELKAFNDGTHAVRIKLEEQTMIATGLMHIEGYTPSGFIVNEVRIVGGVLLLPKTCLHWAAPATAAELTLESMAVIQLMHPSIELLLIGTGARTVPLPPAMREALRRRGTAVEAMDSKNACSTFNFMISDQRRVAALLMPVKTL